MEATDLMLGDWVYNTHNRQNEQVAEIVSGLVMLAYNDLYEYDEIEPIPLTPEILEKNGFESIITIFDGLTYQYANIDEEYRVRVFVNDKNIATGIEIDSKVCWLNNDCSFVHELQHALKMCWIKKEIEL